MTKDLDITEVAVYTEDGRSSSLATFHGWDKREDGWWGHVKVFDAPDGGQVWQTATRRPAHPPRLLRPTPDRRDPAQREVPEAVRRRLSTHLRATACNPSPSGP